MSRCGCTTGACSCIIQPGQGTSIPGNGSIANPYVPSVRLSRDAGNCLRFGSDAGLFGPCDADEAQDICGISVNNLPDERVVFGRGGAGRLLAPDHSLESFKRAVDLGLDGSHAHVRELGDGTPVCFPSASLENQTGLEGVTLADMGVNGYKTLPIRSGWNTEVTTNLGRRHGFFGFGESDRVGGTTLAEVLATVGRRSVLMLEMFPPYSDSFPDKVLSLIFRYCSQEAVIVASRIVEDLEPFANAGIPTLAVIPDADAAAVNPPSRLADLGIEWMSGRVGLVGTDDFLGYSTAGINVIGYMCNRHYQWAYLDEIGARGCLSDDGLYMTGDPGRYRSPTMAESLQQPQVQPGMMGYWTDQRIHELSEGPGVPGEVYFPHQGRGFYFPRDYPGAAAAFYMPGRGPSSVDEYSGAPYRTSSGVFDVLTGWLNPIPDPTTYTFDLEMSYRDTPGVNRPAGLLLGLGDDRAYEDVLAANLPFWAVGLRWNGSLFCERWENGSQVSTDYTDGPQLVEDTFYRIRIVVTPEAVTIQRLSSAGAVQTEASVADSATRGPYTALFKNEVRDGQWYPFAVAWRNLSVTGPGVTTRGAAGARIRQSAPAVVDDTLATGDSMAGQAVNRAAPNVGA